MGVSADVGGTQVIKRERAPILRGLSETQQFSWEGLCKTVANRCKNCRVSRFVYVSTCLNCRRDGKTFQYYATTVRCSLHKKTLKNQGCNSKKISKEWPEEAQLGWISSYLFRVSKRWRGTGLRFNTKLFNSESISLEGGRVNPSIILINETSEWGNTWVMSIGALPQQLRRFYNVIHWSL